MVSNAVIICASVICGPLNLGAMWRAFAANENKKYWAKDKLSFTISPALAGLHKYRAKSPAIDASMQMPEMALRHPARIGFGRDGPRIS